ncbi:penicillin-insensitive murein endopeptidase [Solirubrobacter taibaiensis]|nr:penicillin-insensitive murein endopeptidase [Solirubrobacter taibaiensis]
MRRLLAVTALVAVAVALAAIARGVHDEPRLGGAETRGGGAETRGGGAEARGGGAETRGSRAEERSGGTRAGAETLGDGETRQGGAKTHGAWPRRARRRAATPRVLWRSSRAVGTHSHGRLVRGVKLPVRGAHFLTWDPVRKVTPNRWWRRYGTDELVRLLLRVTRAYGRTHPRAPRVLIGDLSRPHGGDFGRRFGPLGHVSHQNGLDADVYFPRKDGEERAPRSPAQVDLRLAQDLVDRFAAAGALTILVGPSLPLRGRGVQPWPHHDDHLHVRLSAQPGQGGA